MQELIDSVNCINILMTFHSYGITVNSDMHILGTFLQVRVKIYMYKSVLNWDYYRLVHCNDCQSNYN
jgi:hypothetical protein